MGIFWNNNDKKVRGDFKNFRDPRYKKNGNSMRGDDNQSTLLANLFNAFMKK